MNSSAKSLNLIWVDMEMTGLNPLTDKVLEIAIVPTDSELNTLDAGFSMVVRYPESIVGEMDEWCLDQHTKNGLINECLKAPNVLTEVEQLSIDYCMRYTEKGKSPLCGNSVFQDRAFMKHHMFGLYSIFHYRIIDVSTVKELSKRWYPGSQEYKKTDKHRAKYDIYESINELKHYKKTIFSLP